ncbi:MAG: MmcQ/YjbR family DNA-binding protein [Oscillospiraceae bacterium]|nr:MmcQ/YjbR family DNA-binding protein [Oscillospiraceae bacterium]
MKNFYISELLKFENVYLDYPFDSYDWAAIRHKDNNRIFALIYQHNGNICINFKNTPEWGNFWRGSFESVAPAYHMNKEHWSMVTIGGDADHEQIITMIKDSYNLTAKKGKKK